MADKFLIAPINSGLVKNMPSWLTPEDSFTDLNNAYLFRGRVKKRVGSNLTGKDAPSSLTKPLRSRLRVKLGTSDAVTGNLSGTVPGSICKPGQMFSCGTEIYTVQAHGTPIGCLSTGSGSMTYYTSGGSKGNYALTAGPTAQDVYFYPSEPVMGISLYESGTINDQTTFAFDTQFIYKYDTDSWVDTYTTTPFTGTDSDFFWCCNWRGVTDDVFAFFATNYTTDNMVYYNGSWNAFNPAFLVAGGNTIDSARIILPFKDRLVMLSTKESVSSVSKEFTNRCRYSHNGSPFATSAFYEANEVGATGGGFIDAPVKEDIVSAAVIKDRLIVYFEHSTWELNYTSNYLLPFVWQQISSDLGSVGTFSVIPFDKHILTISDNGVTACDGVNVDRIDKQIPDDIFDIVNTSTGLKRICGERDFYNELVYWNYYTYDNSSYNSYPDKMMVYNYNNSTWSFNDDCFTHFGFMQKNSDEQQRQPNKVIGGNQQGFILSFNSNKYTNAPSMQISNMTTGVSDMTIVAVDHNLLVGDYVEIKNAQGVSLTGTGIYKVTERTDADTVKLDGTFTGTYTGGGTLSRVSQISIKSTEWNPYAKDGMSVCIPKIDFCVLKTTNGQFLADYFTSSASLSLVDEGTSTGAILGDNIVDTTAQALIPYESVQTRLWRTVDLQASGDTVQLHLTMNDTQMKDIDIINSAIEIQGLLLHAYPCGGRL